MDMPGIRMLLNRSNLVALQFGTAPACSLFRWCRNSRFLLGRYCSGKGVVSVQKAQGNRLGLAFAQGNVLFPVGIRPIRRGAKVVAILLQTSDHKVAFGVRM